MLNLWLVLGLKPGASLDEIRSAYRLRARDTHPDHGGDPDDFAEVSEAYSTLRDDERRKAWEADYRERARRCNAAICNGCFSAQRREGNHCRICGERMPEDPAASFRLPPRLERLRADLADQLGDAAIDIGARIGDEIASATIDGVNRGLALLAARLGRKAARRR